METGCITLFGPLKQILLKLKIFFLQICTLAEQVMRNTLLGVWSNSLLINFEKLLTELNGSHYTELENLNLNLDFEFQ
jgi:hypothetical protein